MARTMAEKLSQARASGFVGRDHELAEFTALVRALDHAAVVVVYGPGGIGKSTLPRQFADRCRLLGATCLSLDARDLPPTAEALAAALAPVLDVDAEAKTVVLIDSYELLAELDGYLRDQLAPQLPANVVLVLAGRSPPSVGWRTEIGRAHV